MPQDAESGRQGLKKGYARADKIGGILGAERLSKTSNEFLWGNRRIVIKTGPNPVVTRNMLERVEAIIFGEEDDQEWVLYEIDPVTFERISEPSRSSGHDESYRQVSKSKLYSHGRVIRRDSN